MALVAYCNLEKTAPANSCLYPENRKMFAISFVIIVAFDPALEFDRIFVERSFGHSLQKLTTVNYLTRDQLLQIKKLYLN